MKRRTISQSESKPRILIVDDQPGNIQALYHAVEPVGDIFMATGGEQALAFCRNDAPPDLILLDVEMPDMNGYEVCQRLKQDHRSADIPVIFVTGHASADDEARALQIGGADFIHKPVNHAIAHARVSTQLTLKAQSDLLRRQAQEDALTQIANRRYFDHALRQEWRHCQRHGAPLSLLLLDVDYFKRYNDDQGHPQGDACLRQVASVIAQNMGRPHDLAARYGGEEFVCLLPQTTRKGALTKAEHIRQQIAQLGLPHPASACAEVVTVSIGAATLKPSSHDAWERLLLLADQALYAAKGAGRNRVEISEAEDG
ncbi:diguanylate cyclase domain-containing protein [Magnetofaba australis]|uniref:diguanylate cyclase n=1 Tax=Magnetofaba australis IT-1 TaxID=1434232 RepID=A0A1Y2K983_9PROT|nr:diguanylate cyclase [Magnetofaba australis]OSM07036.1 putative response regulator receiver modulated diguanylate cyclase [Magnetofaba australis IT-1]